MDRFLPAPITGEMSDAVRARLEARGYEFAWDLSIDGALFVLAVGKDGQVYAASGTDPYQLIADCAEMIVQESDL